VYSIAPPWMAALVTVWMTSSVTNTWVKLDTGSTVVVGLLSSQMRFVFSVTPSVVLIIPVGVVTVPTAISPLFAEDGEAEVLELGETEDDGEVDADGERDAEELGLTEEDGDREDEGLNDSEALLDGLRDPDGEVLAEGDNEVEPDGDKLELGEPDCEVEGEILADMEAEPDELGLVELEGEVLALGLTEELGLCDREEEALGDTEALGEAEEALKLEVTRPNSLNRIAPVTLNRVAVPIAPALVAPVKVMVLVA
jgi:hypothetical protein